MKTSAPGRALIEKREGRRLTAYHDSRGILTIGVGHTGRMSPPNVTAGMTITEAQCDAMLAADLAPVEAVINAAVKVPLSQNEFDAMASLGFNIGAAGLRTSSVVKRLNLGDLPGAAQAFMLWDHPAVLEGRRAAERAQFLASDPIGGPRSGRPETVAASRAAALGARAAKVKDESTSACRAGAVAAVVGSTGTALAAHGHRAPLAVGLGLIVVAGLVADMVVAWRRRTIAMTLAGNAMRQAAIPDPLPSGEPVLAQAASHA